MSAPDLHAAADVIDLAQGVVDRAIRHLAEQGGPDRHQTVAYDLAHAAAQVAHRASAARLRREGRDRGEDHLRVRRRHGCTT